MRAAWLLATPVCIYTVYYTPVCSDIDTFRGKVQRRPEVSAAVTSEKNKATPIVRACCVRAFIYLSICLQARTLTRPAHQRDGVQATRQLSVDRYANGGGAAPHVCVWIVAKRQLAP